MLDASRTLFASVVLASMLGLVAGPSRADDPAPSPEQLTERTEELRSVWSTFQDNIASLHFGTRGWNLGVGGGQYNPGHGS